MKRSSDDKVNSKRRKGGLFHPFLSNSRTILFWFLIFVMMVGLGKMVMIYLENYQQDKELIMIQENLKPRSKLATLPKLSNIGIPTSKTSWLSSWVTRELPLPNDPSLPAAMKQDYLDFYEKNNDFIGWLTIVDTNIDYPVMQTLFDEDYYLYRDFNQKYNRNGSLIMDTDSVVGNGTRVNQYKDGSRPSTNLIIHGHAMFSGNMFGRLHLFEKEDYGRKHRIITFHSLYETRQYELISVFYSEVYYANDKVFKYYNFFEAENEADFEDWYHNIKDLSIYDTGVEAKFGDEFITLSTCAYHKEDARFVVIAKRM